MSEQFLFEETQQDHSSSPSFIPARLPELWRKQARQLELLGIASDAAKVFVSCANVLEDAIRAAEDQLLSVGEAALRSGYSADHLARLIRDGVIPNAGRHGKPLIRVRDLPRRAAVADAERSDYDPSTDARSLRDRGRRDV